MVTTTTDLRLQPGLTVTGVRQEPSRDLEALRQQALETLATTSRTFYIPISCLPPGLLEAVASAYLCLRAIDEIEDHPKLDNQRKASLLHDVSHGLQSAVETFDGSQLLISEEPGRSELPEVTLRLADWVSLAPPGLAPRIWDATAAMADRMAEWAQSNWQVSTEADLDRYTFGVAGAVGLLLSDIWAWHCGVTTHRIAAIGFGRGLQSVNILRNRQEDLARGVDFFPDGWQAAEMHAYARRNLSLGDAYLAELPPGPVYEFCRIPLALAHATLDALAAGRLKLERQEVLAIVASR